MSKISNMLNMLRILKDKKRHSISSLAEELEVSERMIRQYKLELEMAGIYIESLTGRYGGYQLNEYSNFLKLNNRSEEKIYVDMKDAILYKNKVKVRYISDNGKDQERIIHPAELFEYYKKWYLVAFCELKKDIRSFKLDNIKKYEVLSEKY